MHAANKIWHNPAGVLSAAAAASLGELGFVPFRSASSECAGALARTALSSKVSWAPLWDAW